MIPPGTDGRFMKARHALAPYRILGTPPEPAFDVFAELVCSALSVSAALLTFFDGETMCVKASAGTPQRNGDIAARLRDVFAFERAIVSSDGSRLFCGAPIVTPDGQPVGAIAGIGYDDRPATPAMHTTILAIAAAVTQALEARRRAESGSMARAHALIAFDAIDLSVVLADADTMRARAATHAKFRALTFDDVFTGVDADARHDIDVLRDAEHDESLAFSARALGADGFWYPVACTARAIRGRRMRTLIVVEFAPPSLRANLHVIAAPTATVLHEHSIDTVLSKIEAGRRALRAEQNENGLPLTVDGLVQAAAQLLADNDDAHVLAVFRVDPDGRDDAIERARRTRLVCDHDLVAVIEDEYVAILLRDLPVAIGRQAVARFARSLPGLRFTVRDASGSVPGVRSLLDDAVGELRAPI